MFFRLTAENRTIYKQVFMGQDWCWVLDKFIGDHRVTAFGGFRSDVNVAHLTEGDWR
jgi:hypothetical protein